MMDVRPLMDWWYAGAWAWVVVPLLAVTLTFALIARRRNR